MRKRLQHKPRENTGCRAINEPIGAHCGMQAITQIRSSELDPACQRIGPSLGISAVGSYSQETIGDRDLVQLDLK
jgi:hypothetical protein